MTWQTKKYNLISSAPLVMHNGRLADPLYSYTIAIKAISAKRTKNEEDYKKMADLEFMGGLYIYKDPITKEEHIVIPADMIDATVTNGAKHYKQGLEAKAGFFANGHAIIEYDGPKNPTELSKLEEFRDVRGVVVQRARIMRCRPIFNNWKATVDLSYEDDIINETKLLSWITYAGGYVGFGDMRPKYGRFSVVD